MDLAIEQAFGLKRIEELHARWSGKSSSIEEKEVLIEREASSGRLGFGVDQTSSSLDRNPNMVVEVDPTGPAASELQAGDIIIAVDGELLNGRKFIEHSSIKSVQFSIPNPSIRLQIKRLHAASGPASGTTTQAPSVRRSQSPKVKRL